MLGDEQYPNLRRRQFFASHPRKNLLRLLWVTAGAQNRSVSAVLYMPKLGEVWDVCNQESPWVLVHHPGGLIDPCHTGYFPLVWNIYPGHPRKSIQPVLSTTSWAYPILGLENRIGVHPKSRCYEYVYMRTMSRRVSPGVSRVQKWTGGQRAGQCSK